MQLSSTYMINEHFGSVQKSLTKTVLTCDPVGQCLLLALAALSAVTNAFAPLRADILFTDIYEDSLKSRRKGQQGAKELKELTNMTYVQSTTPEQYGIQDQARQAELSLSLQQGKS